MKKPFDIVPEPIREEVLQQLRNIHQLVLEEAYQSFTLILEKYKDLTIYNIGLYYSAGAWSYLIPTFSSDEGLALTAERYSKHSVSGIEEQKISLRWSPCDSPHHGREDVEAMMSKTQDALDTLRNILDRLDPDYNEQFKQLYTEDDYYEIIDAVHEILRVLVADALREIRTSLASLNKLDLSRCIVTLSVGDLSEEVFLDSLHLINGDELFEKVSQELSAAQRQHELEFDLMQKKLEDERANPPSTQLILSDFQSEIEKFNPKFIRIDGGVYLDVPCDYPRDDSSETEKSFNRIEFMKLLESSNYYDELDRLFGHFLGNNFQTDDLLPSICRAFAMKLGEALIDSFPSDAFKIYMIVDRNCLYHMTFCKQRHDGFQFDSFKFDAQYGVEEIYRVGEDKIVLC